MKTRGRTAMKKCISAITTAALLLCLVTVGVATPAQHEGHGGQKPLAPAKYNRRQPEMRRQGGQMEMSVMTLNNLLVMSYLQNIATYARLLRDQVQQCGSVDGDFARDVTAEIWRNFDRLDCYWREQMAQGGIRTASMRDHSSMAPMAANAPSEYLALREIGAERGPLTPPSPAVEGDQMTDTMQWM